MQVDASIKHFNKQKQAVQTYYKTDMKDNRDMDCFILLFLSHLGVLINVFKQ